MEEIKDDEYKNVKLFYKKMKFKNFKKVFRMLSYNRYNSFIGRF